MNYRFLTIVALLSISMWLDFISILTYVGYELELSAIHVALVSIAMLFPQAFLGKYLSKIVKNLDTQKVFVWSTTGRVVCTIVLVWIDSIYLLIPILLVRAFFLGLLQPIIASQAKELAKSQGSRFSSILNLINTFSKIAAPSIGGVISVLMSERHVFVISGILAMIALLIIVLNPLKSVSVKKPTSQEENASQIDMLLPFALVIIFISGLSAMYTNLIPYAFNLYDVPKITLSIALTASATSGFLFNLIIMKVNPSTTSFPTMHFFSAWVLSALFFAGLTLSMQTGPFSLILIPIAFAGITVARAYFEVFSNAYIYIQESDQAISLATLKQSLVSIVSIIATIFGAIGFTYIEPFRILLAMACISMVTCLLWLLVFSKVAFDRCSKKTLYVKMPKEKA